VPSHFFYGEIYWKQLLFPHSEPEFKWEDSIGKFEISKQFSFELQHYYGQVPDLFYGEIL
jgi:hypothetical protein